MSDLVRSMPVRVVVVALAISVPAGLPTASAEPVDALYVGRVIVTGQDNLTERRRGTSAALAEVLVKVSGDFRVTGDPRAGALLARAGDFVLRRDYLDRKKGIQISDEQGTRDRSFWLTVTFSAERVDRALRAIGRPPWAADRPRLLVMLRVDAGAGRFLVTERSRRGYGQREAVRVAGRRAGLPLSLPGRTAPWIAAATQDELARPEERRRLLAAVARERVDGVLIGAMRVTPKGYWDTRWTLSAGAAQGIWRIDGTTFDRSIAFGVGQAALTLAGRR